MLVKFCFVFAEKKDKVLFMTTKHGGHLGYFEGGYVVPDHITWLDRVLVQYADAVVDMCLHGKLTSTKISSTDASVKKTEDRINMVHDGKDRSKEKVGSSKNNKIEFHDSHTSGKDLKNLMHDISESSQIT